MNPHHPTFRQSCRLSIDHHQRHILPLFQ